MLWVLWAVSSEYQEGREEKKQNITFSFVVVVQLLSRV